MSQPASERSNERSARCCARRLAGSSRTLPLLLFLHPRPGHGPWAAIHRASRSTCSLRSAGGAESFGWSSLSRPPLKRLAKLALLSHPWVRVCRELRDGDVRAVTSSAGVGVHDLRGLVRRGSPL